MLDDDVLQEVRTAREAYARAHGYDVRAMVADLRSRDLAGDWTVVRHPPRRSKPVTIPAVIPHPEPQQTGKADEVPS